MCFFAGSLRDARVVVVALTEAVLLRTPPYSSGRTTPVDSNHLFTGSRQVRAVSQVPDGGDIILIFLRCIEWGRGGGDGSREWVLGGGWAGRGNRPLDSSTGYKTGRRKSRAPVS